ncbi:histone-fold-containing protein [Tuber indicum]|nr:histone-fold-containing protein [Tuber indicum]
MPYNTSAIPPSEEVTGHSALPLSRVKKIIRLDDDVNGCSNNAAFLVTIAAEMFVQYLAEQGLKMTYGDRKQRKTMQYKDLATAVARVENLEFLADVIPPTVPYKQVRERKNNKTAKDTETGQLTLNGQRILPIGSSNGRKKGSAESDTIAVASGRERGVNGDKGNEIEMS